MTLKSHFVCLLCSSLLRGQNRWIPWQRVFINRWEDRRIVIEFLFSLQALWNWTWAWTFYYRAVSPVSDPAVDTRRVRSGESGHWCFCLNLSYRNPTVKLKSIESLVRVYYCGVNLRLWLRVLSGRVHSPHVCLFTPEVLHRRWHESSVGQWVWKHTHSCRGWIIPAGCSEVSSFHTDCRTCCCSSSSSPGAPLYPSQGGGKKQHWFTRLLFPHQKILTRPRSWNFD